MGDVRALPTNRCRRVNYTLPTVRWTPNGTVGVVCWVEDGVLPHDSVLVLPNAYTGPRSHEYAIAEAKAVQQILQFGVDQARPESST